ncbi:MAG: hypothetical protein Q8S73_27695 [Deltaproteobacteria bacterium]|nr:hypothetical protein [Myxococcales bacterium]MDP3217920.1 hypothetical protein [Deltaproteobacteria bacterium]
MRSRAWAIGLLAAAAAACSSSRPARATRVEREQLVVADGEVRNRWFATLYSLQRQLATADARRLDVIGPLQSMLCLPSDATLARMASVAQARLTQEGVTPTRTRLRRTVDSEQAIARWIDATATGGGDLVERESLIAVEETLIIERPEGVAMARVPLPTTGVQVAEPRCEPGVAEGAQGAEGRAVLMQIMVVLRRAAAQGLVFQRTVLLAAELRSQLASLRAGATGPLAAEFAAAERALVGVSARATMHLHESARTQQWAQTLLTPEGETAPEEVPDVQPEDNDPENVAPTDTVPITAVPVPPPAADGGT